MNLIAQTDPLNGWFGVILQGGAFALLTYIVVWMAPDALKQAREERQSRDAIFSAIIDVIQLKTDERNKELIEAIRSQTTTLTVAIGNSCRYPAPMGSRSDGPR